MTEILTVKSGRQDKQVVLWEVHPEHPGGEAFVAGDRPVQVAATAMVRRRIGAGLLVEVEVEVEVAESEPRPTGSRPWPDYDELTVDEILTRLLDAEPAERGAVVLYEMAHKRRKTLLGE